MYRNFVAFTIKNKEFDLAGFWNKKEAAAATSSLKSCPS
jgi:hypothetical protein